jgi:hypothetical protein
VGNPRPGAAAMEGGFGRGATTGECGHRPRVPTQDSSGSAVFRPPRPGRKAGRPWAVRGGGGTAGTLPDRPNPRRSTWSGSTRGLAADLESLARDSRDRSLGSSVSSQQPPTTPGDTVLHFATDRKRARQALRHAIALAIATSPILSARSRTSSRPKGRTVREFAALRPLSAWGGLITLVRRLDHAGKEGGRSQAKKGEECRVPE